MPGALVVGRQGWLVLIEVLTLVLIAVFFWQSRSFQAASELRMMFWHPKGTPKIPNDLLSESSTRKVLESSIVRERVNLRLSWQITEEDYSGAVDLASKRHDWNLSNGVFLEVTALASSPQRAVELCNVASEEFSGRCQELSQEYNDLFWNLETAKVHGPLEKWKYDKQVADEKELLERAVRLRRRLLLSIAATQMKRRELNQAGGVTVASSRTAKLVKTLREVESSLDELWLRGVDNETVSELQEKQRAQKKRLGDSLLADQTAALKSLEAALEKLRKLESEFSPEVVQQSLDELGRLNDALVSLNNLQDFQQMSMYCAPVRPAKAAFRRGAGWVELWPIALCGLLLLFAVLYHRRLRLQAAVP